VVPGVPFYLQQSNAPGGKIINAAAFSIPAAGQGDLGRNALRGFGATQLDLTLRRQFRFTERLSLQARADFFNILNHPNRQSRQQPNQPIIRPIDANARQQSGVRWR